MTWREQRTVARLGAVLCVLMVAVLVVLGMKYRENRAEPASSSSAAAASAAEEHTACTALTYYNGTATLDFRRSESGKWVWTAEEDFPLDDTQLTAILETLSAMAPRETIEAVEDLDDLGLEAPRATISATYEGGSTFSLSFGNATAEGNGCYVLQNGASSPVYIYDAGILELMNMGIYDMCILPEFPSLTETTAQRITIQGVADANGVVPRSTMDANGEGEALSFISDGKNITDKARVKDLFEDLSAFAYEKCVIYRPSDEAVALCGFSAPTATLWANYVTATDIEEHLQLTIGNLTLDGGARYVRLGGDESIYAVPTELLDSILVIALSGFSG